MTQHDTSTPLSSTRQVCVAVIGAGTAGQSAYRRLKSSIDDVVIINDGFWTTTCATVGCMPSKLMIAAAQRAHSAKHSAEFGVNAQVHIDGPQVMRRVQNERDRFTGFIKDSVADWPQNDKIAGRAHINSAGHIEVGDQCIAAKYMVLATGSTPFVPNDWGKKLGNTMLTTDQLFELSDVPESMAVIGAGAIGLEMAQAFNRLGCQVTLFNRQQRVGGLSDDAINQKAIDCLGRELTMQLASRIDAVSQVPSHNGTKQNARIDFTDANGQAQHLECQYVLVATGRHSHLQPLGVENLGVKLDEQGQPQQLNEATGQIGDLPVYVIGDANAYLPLLHVASDEGFNASGKISNEMHDNQKKQLVRKATPLSMVFCEPQIANVGQSLEQIKSTGRAYVVGEVSFDDQGRSRVMGVNCGLLRLYACQNSGELWGASMVAPDAEYLSHILATAITNRLTINQLLEAPFYHPTILEGLRSALQSAQKQLEMNNTGTCDDRVGEACVQV